MVACIEQIIEPEIPAEQFKLDPNAKRQMRAGLPPRSLGLPSLVEGCWHNRSNRRARTRMHGGVAGVSGQPCDSHLWEALRGWQNTIEGRRRTNEK